jgi:hypothetical protein
MITHCRKCNINWAQLFSQDDEDSTYEYCPLCQTDSFLGPGTDITAYIMDPISGKIIDFDTKQELVRQGPTPRLRESKAPPAMTETENSRQERELEAITAYQASGNKQDYFKTIKKV